MLFTSPALSTILAISLLSLLISLYLYLRLQKLNRLRSVFFAGKSGGDLETLLYALSTKLTELENKGSLSEAAIYELQNNLQFAIQKIGVVRFNPFGDGGGNFSFSIALLNSYDTGLVITSMYGREQNRIYAKKIENGLSESTLTAEEEKAIRAAGLKQNSGS